MKILLDFDGVMVTTPTWRAVPQLDDGFMAFDAKCAQNLADVLTATKADIVLTTTHRIHYENDTWHQLLQNRGLVTNHVSKVNAAKDFKDLKVRCDEVMAWVQANSNETYVVIDDDKSLRNLPDTIKKHWVETSFHNGFTQQAKLAVLNLLLND